MNKLEANQVEQKVCDGKEGPYVTGLTIRSSSF